MKDTKKLIRNAIYAALTGNITYDSVAVPVVDEKLRATQTADNFIVLAEQEEFNIENNDSAFITRSSIVLEVINKSGYDVSKDVIDDIYESAMEILLPTTTTIGLTVPAGFQFLNAERESCGTRNVSLSNTESILVSFTKLVFTIVQQ